jgi:hypothetical protein
MTDKDKAHEALNSAEALLEMLYHRGKTFINGVRAKVDEAVVEDKPEPEKEYIPDYATMLSDLAAYHEGVYGVARSFYRDVSLPELNDQHLAHLKNLWNSLPDNFKTKRPAAQQNGPAKTEILDALKDLGRRMNGN